MTSYGIEKAHDGIRAFTPSSDCETTSTFRYALTSFSYLVNNGEMLSIAEFKSRIEKNYADSARMRAIFQALDKLILLESLA